jgi:predicted AAA+ superfamily ATPase
MLVSALLFHKKELTIKNIESGYLSKQASRTELKKIEDELETVGVADVEEVRLDLSEQLPPTVKRCILEVGLEQVRYLIYKP